MLFAFQHKIKVSAFFVQERQEGEHILVQGARAYHNALVAPYQVSVFCQGQRAGFAGPVHVDDPLVGASAVSESQVALRLYVFSVNQNVDGVQQLSQRFPVFCQPTGAFRTGTGQAGQFLQRVPGIHPDI